MTTEEKLALQIDSINLPIYEFIHKYINIVIEDGNIVSADLKQ